MSEDRYIEATDAEKEALELMQRGGPRLVRGEMMTAEYAADRIIELAERIEIERRQKVLERMIAEVEAEDAA